MTTATEKHKALLDKLSLQDVNAGACTGPEGWITDQNGKEIESLDPTTNGLVLSVSISWP